MKALYERLWAGKYRDRDRQYGKRYARVIDLLKPHGSIADWGCGQGRLSLALHMDGHLVFPVDIAENSMDPDVEMEIGERLIIGSIDEIELPHPVQYSICTDVLEHLTDSTLERAVHNIMDQTYVEAYFYVACFGDIKEYNGEMYVLHQTVEKPQWWSDFFQDKGILTYEKLDNDYHLYECKVKPWTS